MNRVQVWAVATIRDEQDIIAYNISHLIGSGVDGIIVCNHCSEDQTADVLYEVGRLYPGFLHVIDRKDPAYLQAETTTMMAETAYNLGATWIIPFDADEMFYSTSSKMGMVETLLTRRDQKPVYGIGMWNHFQTSKDPQDEPNPFKRMLYKHPIKNSIDKVIIKWEPGMKIAKGNHGVFGKDGSKIDGAWVGINIRHFPNRNAEQFVTKSIAHGRGITAAGDLYPVEASLHNKERWRIYNESGAQGLIDIYNREFYIQEPDELLKLDPAPYEGDL
jgi:hypothetical protein